MQLNPEEVRATKFHVASVTFSADHPAVAAEHLRPMWVYKRRKRGGAADADKGADADAAGGAAAGEADQVKEGDEVDGLWSRSRGREYTNKKRSELAAWETGWEGAYGGWNNGL